jgi:hypothetical protein
MKPYELRCNTCERTFRRRRDRDRHQRFIHGEQPCGGEQSHGGEQPPRPPGVLPPPQRSPLPPLSPPPIILVETEEEPYISPLPALLPPLLPSSPRQSEATPLLPVPTRPASTPLPPKTSPCSDVEPSDDDETEPVHPSDESHKLPPDIYVDLISPPPPPPQPEQPAISPPAQFADRKTVGTQTNDAITRHLKHISQCRRRLIAPASDTPVSANVRSPTVVRLCSCRDCVQHAVRPSPNAVKIRQPTTVRLYDLPGVPVIRADTNEIGLALTSNITVCECRTCTAHNQLIAAWRLCLELHPGGGRMSRP